MSVDSGWFGGAQRKWTSCLYIDLFKWNVFNYEPNFRFCLQSLFRMVANIPVPMAFFRTSFSFRTIKFRLNQTNLSLKINTNIFVYFNVDSWRWPLPSPAGETVPIPIITTHVVQTHVFGAVYASFALYICGSTMCIGIKIYTYITFSHLVFIPTMINIVFVW